MAEEKIEEDNKELNSIDGNSIFIHGIFDETISKNIIPKLIKEIDIQEKIKEGRLKFYINSRGGYAHMLLDLLALIEIAKKKGIIVETYVFAYAYSCGSLLACSGSKGHRYISYNAEHLCHLGSASTGDVINDTELERSMERVQAHFDRVRSLYKKYANVIDLEEAIKNDNYFLRGQTIIDNGLADNYVD